MDKESTYHMLVCIQTCALTRFIPVIKVATHHVMRHQGPSQTTVQRRLPRCQGDTCHTEGVCLTSCPRQQILHWFKTTGDWFSGVSIIMFLLKTTGNSMYKNLQDTSFNSDLFRLVTLPGSGDAVYVTTSQITESVGWSKQDSNLIKDKKPGKGFFYGL